MLVLKPGYSSWLGIAPEALYRFLMLEWLWLLVGCELLKILHQSCKRSCYVYSRVFLTYLIQFSGCVTLVVVQCLLLSFLNRTSHLLLCESSENICHVFSSDWQSYATLKSNLLDELFWGIFTAIHWVLLISSAMSTSGMRLWSVL